MCEKLSCQTYIALCGEHPNFPMSRRVQSSEYPSLTHRSNGLPLLSGLGSRVLGFGGLGLRALRFRLGVLGLGLSVGFK